MEGYVYLETSNQANCIHISGHNICRYIEENKVRLVMV